MLSKNIRMDIMCKKCKRTTDATMFPAHKVAIKCENCGDGWLITPTGTFDGRLVYLKKVFTIASKDTVSIIISKNLDTAMSFFENVHGEEVIQTLEIKPKDYQEMTFITTYANEDGSQKEFKHDLCDVIFHCEEDNQEVVRMTMEEYLQRFNAQKGF